MLANPDKNRSELMSKALNYLKDFWNQIFAYRNDGEYSIDNMAAEREIRPIHRPTKEQPVLRSVKGIQNSTIYNTYIETSKQTGVSFKDNFCKLLIELKKGRTDYENLPPMTNMQIIIVKFIDSFFRRALAGTRLKKEHPKIGNLRFFNREPLKSTPLYYTTRQNWTLTDTSYSINICHNQQLLNIYLWISF